MNTSPIGLAVRHSSEHPWDVMTSLADLTFFFNEVVERNQGRPPPSATAPLPSPYVEQKNPYIVTQGEVGWWWECVSNIHSATDALISACEDLVEQHTDDPRLAALKTMLAHAQGLSEYDPRSNRR
jgi:hypothetical protein